MSKKNCQLENGFIRDEKLLEELTDASDRAKVILGAAIIDELLERLLRGFFVQDNKKIESVFEGATGYLGTFSAKIKTTFLLGLISEELFKDLEIVRKIRNQFAHNILDCDFSSPSIKDLCNNFTFAKAVISTNWDEAPQDALFIMEIAFLEVALIRKITRVKALPLLPIEEKDLGFEDKDWKYLNGE